MPETHDQGPRQRRGSRYHLHRDGGYVGLDADVDVAYGDGTPESLAHLLRRPRTDAWDSDHSAWDPARPSWPDEEEAR